MITSTAALVPALTRIDQRVLAVLDDHGREVRAIVRELYPVTTRSAGATPEQRREVVEILRGLECVGRAHERDGLWRIGSSS
jgi:hypothetical protein